MVAQQLRHYFGTYKIVILTSYPMKNILGNPNQFGLLSKITIELCEFEIHYKLLSAIKEQTLANFTVEWTHEPTYELEAIVPVSMTIVPTRNLWKAYIDRTKNSRGSWIGIVILTPTRGLIKQCIPITFKATNNKLVHNDL